MSIRHHVNPIVLLALVSACSEPRSTDGAPAADVASVRRSLDSSLAVHAQHFIAGDLTGLVSGYADSAIVRPAHMEPVRGHEQLGTVLGAWLKAAPIKTLAYTTEDLAVYGDSAFQITSYRSTMQPPGAGEISDHGTCVLFWVRKPDLGWRIHRSTCNSSVPLPAPASPNRARRN